jgi:hypothetical protein
MQAYEGFIENGQFYPIGTPTRIKGRRRVIMTVLDEPKQEKTKKTLNEIEKRKLLRELCGSVDDPTFVAPPEIPWELYSPIEEIE